MLDMDFLDRRIMAVLRDGGARSFQQILSEVAFSHNSLQHHLDQLIDQVLIERRKNPGKALVDHDSSTAVQRHRWLDPLRPPRPLQGACCPPL